MTQEPKINGGWEALFFDTLTPEQRELVRFVQGMAPPQQAAWMATKLVKIETVLDSYTAKQLLAQSEATERALKAVQPVILANKGNWTITAAQRARAFAIGGSAVAIAAGAAKALGFL